MKQEFNVGDRVRVKSWDDLASYFGVDCDGNINIEPCEFSIEEFDWCGRSATVTAVYPDLDVIGVDTICLSFDIEDDYDDFVFRDDMLEQIKLIKKINENVSKRQKRR